MPTVTWDLEISIELVFSCKGLCGSDRYGHSRLCGRADNLDILTDPVLFPRIGIRLPGLTLGPKRLTASALTVRDFPKIDIVLLSHAHFDHFDMRTLHRFDRSTRVIRL
ncbi:MAG: MBL fold metallo-hydrolase [Methylocella sp.]